MRRRAFPAPPPEIWRELPWAGRLHFAIARRMNEEPAKSFWTVFQRSLGMGWVAAATARQTVVHGLEHFVATDSRRPVLLVANHRSYFDLYVATSVILRRTRRPTRIFFPVRGRFFYETVRGLLLNFIGSYWSMFPPLYATERQRAFNRYAVELLTGLCREGEGHIIGIHPEGGRNRDPDPYSFRKLQPGAGSIVYAARPQVIPVFIGGLPNGLGTIVLNNFRARAPIRVHFGAAVDLAEFYDRPAKGSTYKAIVEHVMERVRALGEEDRRRYGGQG